MSFMDCVRVVVAIPIIRLAYIMAKTTWMPTWPTWRVLKLGAWINPMGPEDLE